jgi:hypothetical protein
VTVIVPSQEFAIPGARPYRAPPGSVTDAQWVSHLAKHPLGALASPWNREALHELTPPVATEADRQAFIRFIRNGIANDRPCGVASFTGANTQATAAPLACGTSCPRALVTQCHNELGAVSARYAALVDALLASVVDGVEVPRNEAFAAILRSATPTRSLEGLVVFAVGIRPNSSYTDVIARLTRFDGVRVDFYVNNRTLAWRTTLRIFPRSATAAARNLVEVPRDDSMSATFVLSRSWWQRQQVPQR